MAQKKIELSLTNAESEHLRGALSLAQQTHVDDYGRGNRQLSSIQSKLEKAVTESERKPKLEALPRTGDGPEPLD